MGRRKQDQIGFEGQGELHKERKKGEESYTLKQLAGLWQVSEKTLLRRVHEGVLPAFTPGPGGKGSALRILSTDAAHFRSTHPVSSSPPSLRQPQCLPQAKRQRRGDPSSSPPSFAPEENAWWNPASPKMGGGGYRERKTGM